MPVLLHEHDLGKRRARDDDDAAGMLDDFDLTRAAAVGLGDLIDP